MRHIYILTAVILLSLSGFSQSLRISQIEHPTHPLQKSVQVSPEADTVQAEHYDIRIDTINFSAQSIRGNTAIKLKALADNVAKFTLLLQDFTVDSVLQNGTSTPFQYDSLHLVIHPSQILNIGDSLSVNIYYHGLPSEDPGGWGGFTFSGVYAFNMGVGFSVNPHVYGRSWFPCIDNFTDKALYDFHVRTVGNNEAHCNGALTSVDTLADSSRVWNWTLNHPIPTYLAGIAVAPYSTHHSISNGVPVEIAAVGGDMNNALNSMAKLDTAVRCFINTYGPYPWNKIGYTTVPFNAGAMEHATNIHIGRAFLDGSLTYETLCPHELSHMWWGDLVTCKTAKDMWLNEGFASFNERLFLEAAYGKKRYKDEIRANHRSVLQFTHITDGGYLAMNQIPHEYTYSSTVYDKGADMVHTLRKFLGDSLYSVGAKHYLSSFAYGNAASVDLKEKLAEATVIDLDNFFEDWIYTPGFPHFYIDSFTVTPTISMAWKVDIYTRQRSLGNTHLYKMPMKFNLSNNGNAGDNYTFLIDSLTNHFSVEVLTPPTMVSIDRAEEMSDAIVDFEAKLKALTPFVVPQTNVTITLLNVPADSALIRTEHHYMKPDADNLPDGIERISDYHFWKIDGNWGNDFLAKAKFEYNGSTNTSTGYLDNTFITGSENYLRMLYREGAGKPWTQVQGFILNKMGSATNKVGNIEVDTLRKGEYAFGWSTQALGLSKAHKPKAKIKLFPNPTSDNITIDLSSFARKSTVDILVKDIQGRTVAILAAFPYQNEISFDVTSLLAGSYTLIASENGKVLGKEKFLVK